MVRVRGDEVLRVVDVDGRHRRPGHVGNPALFVRSVILEDRGPELVV